MNDKIYEYYHNFFLCFCVFSFSVYPACAFNYYVFPFIFVIIGNNSVREYLYSADTIQAHRIVRLADIICAFQNTFW